MLKVYFFISIILLCLSFGFPRPQYQYEGYWDGNRYIYPNGTMGPYWNGSVYYYPNTYPTQSTQVGNSAWGWTGGNYGPGGWYWGPNGWTYYPGWNNQWWLRNSQYPTARAG
ncbi:hypothetical protein FQR65_LT07663 [Abscondita terminalis]|nr:hypothetical protein FQR65_LT07663 [Abscondita terminalis]